ncbi:MAG: hypothetical protein EBR86_13465 [Planctomycetia bacterium]|nr:hypothetical protein [Planctomycetia bacterium]
MTSLIVLSTTAALMGGVAAACTVLCLAWSIPAWRRRLDRREVAAVAGGAEAGGLTGWPARVASGLVSVGIASCAAVGWYGCYSVLAALIAAHR